MADQARLQKLNKENLNNEKCTYLIRQSPQKRQFRFALRCMRGAKEAGNNVTKINVASKKIAPCHACYFCGEHGGECVYKDDMAEILQAMIDADVLVLASPVYFYSIDAQLKAVIDRTVARWLEVKDKEFYYIMTAADEDKSSMETTLACFRGYADCVNGAKEMGVIYGTGVYEKGKILNTRAMAQAYEMGKNV